MKKLLTVLLSVLMVLTLGAVNVSAEVYYSDPVTGTFATSSGLGWNVTSGTTQNNFTVSRGENLVYTGEKVTLYKVEQHLSPKHESYSGDRDFWPGCSGSGHYTGNIVSDSNKLQYRLSKDGVYLGDWKDVPDNGEITATDDTNLVTQAGTYKIQFQYVYTLVSADGSHNKAMTIAMNANNQITDASVVLGERVVTLPSYTEAFPTVDKAGTYNGSAQTVLTMNKVNGENYVEPGLSFKYYVDGTEQSNPTDNNVVKIENAKTGGNLTVEDSDYYEITVVATLEENHKWPNVGTQALAGWTAGSGVASAENFTPNGTYYKTFKAYIDRAVVLPTLKLTSGGEEVTCDALSPYANSTVDVEYNHKEYRIVASDYTKFGVTAFESINSRGITNNYLIEKTNVGSETRTLTLKSNPNFYFATAAENGDRTDELVYTLTIHKLVVNPVTVENKTGLVFDNTVHELVKTTIPTCEEASNGISKIEYKVTYTDMSGVKYTPYTVTTLPTERDAGTYEIETTVYYDGNHRTSDMAETATSVTLEPVMTEIAQRDLLTASSYTELNHTYCRNTRPALEWAKLAGFDLATEAEENIFVTLGEPVQTAVDNYYAHLNNVVIKIDGVAYDLDEEVWLYHGTHTVEVEVEFGHISGTDFVKDNNIKSIGKTTVLKIKTTGGSSAGGSGATAATPETTTTTTVTTAKPVVKPVAKPVVATDVE